MQQTPSARFQQGLGARIDAIEIALRTLPADEAAATELRNQAKAIAGPAREYGFAALAGAADRVAAAPRAELDVAARNLVQALRDQAAKSPQRSGTVLIVGGESGFNERVADAVRSPSRQIVQAASAAEALRLIQQREVLCIVLSLFLPDMDGRSLLVRLRENPLTASLPILLLASRADAEFREGSLLLDADSLIETPSDPAEVAAWVAARLRRANEASRPARRDPLTGLLNRAGFREILVKAVEDARAAQETLALAILAVDDPRTNLPQAAPDVRAAVLDRIGSILSSLLRSTDVVGRWEMDEFIVLLPGEDQFGGARAVEKVIEAIRAESFTSGDGRPMRVTLSGGVAAVTPGKGIEDAISEADRFLFQAAKAGGDRVAASQTRGPKRADRVLLVISEEITARVIRHLLEREGFGVTHVPSAAGPIESIAGEQRFDLIIIDEAAPPRGGFEILGELRAHKRNSRVPIVMLIARNADASMARALELGANDYVMRPFSPLTFIRRMRRMLKRGPVAKLPPGNVASVLIVDREARNLLLAASALHERGGFVPYLSRDAADAARRLSEVRPDVLVLDTELGGAADLLAQASAMSDGPRVILACTKGSAGSDAVARLRTPAVSGVLDRPFDALSLGTRILDLSGLPPSQHRPAGASEHLRAEISRVTSPA